MLVLSNGVDQWCLAQEVVMLTYVLVMEIHYVFMSLQHQQMDKLLVFC